MLKPKNTSNGPTSKPNKLVYATT